ncbi:hypothetical protein Ciccas_002002 [Cichlidogyrus casuarinus]|uniref:Uncharacterized protein n=1 Tax=Cichlidogyrus casuarinus TaxID=1844966 RepID=A0ABD2QIJ4_9PLAT
MNEPLSKKLEKATPWWLETMKMYWAEQSRLGAESKLMHHQIPDNFYTSPDSENNSKTVAGEPTDMPNMTAAESVNSVQTEGAEEKEDGLYDEEAVTKDRRRYLGWLCPPILKMASDYGHISTRRSSLLPPEISERELALVNTVYPLNCAIFEKLMWKARSKSIAYPRRIMQHCRRLVTVYESVCFAANDSCLLRDSVGQSLPDKSYLRVTVQDYVTNLRLFGIDNLFSERLVSMSDLVEASLGVCEEICKLKDTSTIFPVLTVCELLTFNYLRKPQLFLKLRLMRCEVLIKMGALMQALEVMGEMMRGNGLNSLSHGESSPKPGFAFSSNVQPDGLTLFTSSSRRLSNIQRIEIKPENSEFLENLLFKRVNHRQAMELGPDLFAKLVLLHAQILVKVASSIEGLPEFVDL